MTDGGQNRFAICVDTEVDRRSLAVLTSAVELVSWNPDLRPVRRAGHEVRETRELVVIREQSEPVRPAEVLHHAGNIPHIVDGGNVAAIPRRDLVVVEPRVEGIDEAVVV